MSKPNHCQQLVQQENENQRMGGCFFKLNLRKIKYELLLYICSLTTVWSSDAEELITQVVGLSG